MSRFCEQLLKNLLPKFRLNPCKDLASLVEAFPEAAQRACSGGLMISKRRSVPASICSENVKFRGEKLCVAAKSISWGALFGNPNGMGKRPGDDFVMQRAHRNFKKFASGFFEENPGANAINLLLPQLKLNGAQSAAYAHE